jgi:light-regulated signal transduction histidine kinase (bacteriophytochrome)
MAEEIVAAHRVAEPEREARVRVQPGLRAWADPGLTRVVLENLLSNAWKYSGKESCARIEFGEMESAGERAFYVRDNGVGFDMRHAEHLFAPFQRLHRAAEFEGTGVGLATVQRIVRRHQGGIWAEAKPKKGATFYFTLGAADGEENSSQTYLKFPTTASGIERACGAAGQKPQTSPVAL